MTPPRLSRAFALLAVLALAGPARPQAAERPAERVARAPARTSPAWVRDAVIYEIFPRNFSAAGNFRGVTTRLDDLKKLGVTTLWLMPIHPVGKERRKGTLGSPYAVRDYYAINPDYGTKDDLKDLVAGAHRRGMKVIIDIVANHTAWDSVLMKNPSYYKHDPRTGKIIPPVPDWSDVAGLDYHSAGLRRYMITMLKYWLREFDLDGFRCDVAGMVPTDFWEQARDELAKVKPDLLMLAEADKPELLVKAFDLDYSWPLHAVLTDVFLKGTPARALRKTWEEDRARYPRGALRLRFADNHDERRAIARFGERGALAASAFVFALDGVPLLYNGMEVGDTTESGAPALFERLPIFWPIAERRPEFVHFYPRLIALRRGSEALRRGDTEWLSNSRDARVVTFRRRAGRESLVVAINFSNRPLTVRVNVPGGDAHEEVTSRPDAAPNAPAARKAAPDFRNLALGAWEFRMFRAGGRP